MEGVSFASAGTDLVRLDWETLELETLWDREPPEASLAGIVGVWHIGETLIVQDSSGCTDCDWSAYYAVSLDGRQQEELFPLQTWNFFGMVPLSGGGALIGKSGDDQTLVTELNAKGKPSTFAPIPGNKEPLHGIIGLE